jgi:hypothetical protein
MEPPKFTQSELTALITEAAIWVQQQREKFRPSAIPLTLNQTAALQPFFPLRRPHRFKNPRRIPDRRNHSPPAILRARARGRLARRP